MSHEQMPQAPPCNCTSPSPGSPTGNVTSSIVPSSRYRIVLAFVIPTLLPARQISEFAPFMPLPLVPRIILQDLRRFWSAFLGGELGLDAGIQPADRPGAVALNVDLLNELSADCL